MKVVSLVPSWTEMLVEAGVDVVGRTRFCIHPSAEIAKITVVGGTKDLDLQKLAALQADLLILDQEENRAWMQEQSPIPTLVTHVTSVASVAAEVQKLSKALASEKLQSIAKRWEQVQSLKRTWDWKAIPAEKICLQRQSEDYENLIYVIWKKPWMTVSKETFIGSMLNQLGASAYLLDYEKKYPEFDLHSLDLKKTYFLFSSEPYPFLKKEKELRELNLQASIVDGESYSWFGVRALRFLESYHSSPTY